ncbi:MerR family transcriptional regulator [Asticcacaulis endophyticus]|uniref:HTH merR-type domain-containing protein n=1 Tax=Asticcacaulis endophyticus TaxID=1395890 RepID=A0A918PS71_9CAUL|nr:MerR family transcriptional regulator [Asticcacaulis endophyticus]GGZ19649.1 hypothetical protein GCM10011273_00140 [Asticcacaulis endophyticus]
MKPPKRHLTLTETARRFGISGKALRLYEEKGLIRPERTRADWRLYGPEQFLRLQQVLALKSFGLPLARISELLSGRQTDLADFLALHEAMLRRQKDDVEQAITLVSSARLKLADQGTLSTDDLIDLTRKTTMTNTPERQAGYAALAAKHLTPEDQSLMTAKGYAGMDKPDTDWNTLIAEANLLMAEDYKPHSSRAMDLARRWMQQVEKATGGNHQLNQKVLALAKDFLSQPNHQSPSSLAMTDYIRKAYGAAIAAGLMPDPQAT